LWAVGIYDLGLTDEQWKRLTLRKYDALVKRFSNKLEREDFQIAKLSAVIYNANVVKRKGNDKRPWIADNFINREKEVKAKPWQQQLQIVEMLNIRFKGTDKRKANG
jgi:hypothetical protein